LDSWEERVGLSKFEVPYVKDDAIKLLNLEVKERTKLTCEECADAVITLSQYSAYVSRASQRLEAEAFLLKEKFNQILGESIALQKAYSPDERKALAIKDNQFAQELDLQRVAAYTKAKRLYLYADRIDRVARAYEILSNVRRRGRQYGE